jgi:hypothetical protein
MWVSTSQNTGFKTIVCEETSTADTTANVNITKTKCGAYSSVDIPETKISGSGVVDGAPAVNQLSYKDIQAYVQAKTKLYFIYKNAADPNSSVQAGAAVYMDGQGYFNSAKVTAQEGDLIKFDWEFTTTGTVDNTADS